MNCPSLNQLNQAVALASEIARLKRKLADTLGLVDPKIEIDVDSVKRFARSLQKRRVKTPQPAKTASGAYRSLLQTVTKPRE